ncbi:MAG: hypothetical protein AAFY59_05730 [Pseudomonadota bacterium]
MLWKKLLTGLATLILVLLGLTAHTLFRFDLMANPVVSEIRSNTDRWGERAVLTPRPFHEAAPRASVQQSLRRAGFTRIADQDVWQRYADEVANGRQVWSRETTRFPCNSKAYVFVSFTENDTLDFAEGTIEEHGCL